VALVTRRPGYHGKQPGTAVRKRKLADELLRYQGKRRLVLLQIESCAPGRKIRKHPDSARDHSLSGSIRSSLSEVSGLSLR
jgi:hypothetical protein